MFLSYTATLLAYKHFKWIDYLKRCAEQNSNYTKKSFWEESKVF